MDTVENTLPVRSSRYFKLYNDWYFMTREGAAIGPYVDMVKVNAAAKVFVAFIAAADNQAVQAFFDACSLEQVTKAGVRETVQSFV